MLSKTRFEDKELFAPTQQKNYSSDIMKTLNYLINLSNEPFFSKSELGINNIDGFKSIIGSLFRFSGYEEFE